MATLANVTISDSGSLTVPSGNTAQRPVSPVNGQLRFNTDSQVLENYANSTWTNPPVTSGLELLLDAGDKQSYSNIGTTLRDTTGTGRNGLLIATPTYLSGNAGTLTFNGTTQYVQVNDMGSSVAFTVQMFLKVVANAGNYR